MCIRDSACFDCDLAESVGCVYECRLDVAVHVVVVAEPRELADRGVAADLAVDEFKCRPQQGCYLRVWSTVRFVDELCGPCPVAADFVGQLVLAGVAGLGEPVLAEGVNAEDLANLADGVVGGAPVGRGRPEGLAEAR